MSWNSDDESQQRFILGFVFGLVALVVLFAIGTALRFQGRQASGTRPPPTAMAVATMPATAPKTRLAEVTETVTVVIPDGASVRVVGGIVNFYFAVGSADLAPGAAEALAAVIKGVEGGQKAVISGYHDTTGDAVQNDQLAQKRAQMVRDVLTGLGVKSGRIDVQRPAVTTGSGNDAEARRVEVKLIDN